MENGELISWFVHLAPPHNFLGRKYTVSLMKCREEMPISSDGRIINVERKEVETYKEALEIAGRLAKQYNTDFFDGKVEEDMQPEECEYQKSMVCPYCRMDNGDDSDHDYSECEKMTCDYCGEDFEVNRDVTVRYTTRRINPQSKREIEEEEASSFVAKEIAKRERTRRG